MLFTFILQMNENDNNVVTRFPTGLKPVSMIIPTFVNLIVFFPQFPISSCMKQVEMPLVNRPIKRIYRELYRTCRCLVLIKSEKNYSDSQVHCHER